MSSLLVLLLTGFLAQMVDGALGMGYGVTSSSLLLWWGLGPVAASASVHLAETATTAMSALSHWRFGNARPRVFCALALPGMVGAFIGAVLLSQLPGDRVKPFIAITLLGLGIYILFRQLGSGGRPLGVERERPPLCLLLPLGFLAGLVDAMAGGGWGPICTTTLMAWGRWKPRHVVGSVDFTEFPVAVTAVLGFWFARGLSEVHWIWVIVILAGGVIAAPLAAWLIRSLPTRLLGIGVGAMIVLTNLRTLLRTWGVPSEARLGLYGAVAIVLMAVGFWVLRQPNPIWETPTEEGGSG